MLAIGKLSTFALLSTTALSTLVSASVTAQQSNEEELSLQEIIVTASRRSERIQDIPYNISAVSGSDIEAANILDSAELLRSVAGVGVIERGSRNAGTLNSVRIRGLNVDGSANGDFATSAAATVSSYVNDTPLFANLVLTDLERVEVLRGPQGTLYGSGALGGTVRYITRKPEFDDFSGQVNASLSSVKGSSSVGWQGNMILNVPVSDTLALRFAGTRQDFPGLTDYVNVYNLDANGVPVAPDNILDPTQSTRTVEDADTYDAWFGRASLRWKPSDTVDIVATYLRQSDNSGGRRAQTNGVDGFGEEYGKYEVGSVQLEPAESDTEMASLEATIDLGFATLTSSTSYYDTSGSSTSENTGFYAQNGWLAFYYNFARPIARADRTYSDKSFVEEIRLVSELDGPVQYTLGLYYQDQDRVITQQSFLPGAGDYIDALFGFDLGTDPLDQDFDYRLTENYIQKAIFGEITYSLTEKLDVTVGGRYFDNDGESVTFMALPFYAGVFPDLTTDPVENSESKLLLKANATYQFNDEHLVYATWSQGFRRGGANGVPLTGFFQEDPAWLSYRSDRVDNYELGFKGATDSLRYTFSLYYVDWSNPQLNTSTTNWAFFAVSNGDSAKTKGVELEINGSLTDSLNYTIGYAFADADLSSDFLDPLGNVIAADGARLPGSPRHMFNVAFDHTYDVSDTMQLITRIDGYAQTSTRNAISSNQRFDQTLSGFSVWNASATLVFDTFDVTLWVKNAFNVEGVTAVFKEEFMGTLPGSGYFGSGAKDQITLPRTFGLSATYRF